MQEGPLMERRKKVQYSLLLAGLWYRATYIYINTVPVGMRSFQYHALNVAVTMAHQPHALLVTRQERISRSCLLMCS